VELRRYLTVLAAALLIVLIGAVGARCAEAMGYINSEQLRRDYVGARDLDAQLEASIADWRAQAREKQKEIDGLQSELQNQRLLLSDEAAADKAATIEQKQAEFEDFLNSVWGVGGLAAQREAELWQPVFDKINEILDEIGTEGEYQMIFDAAHGNIVYAAPSTDLTEQVLEKLNGAEE
jgi:Skp family chaperone for outer membrane proteins